MKYQRNVMIMGLFGQIYDSLVNYCKDSFILDPAEHVKVVKATTNKTQAYYEAIKNEATDKDDVLQDNEIILSVDPNLELTFDELDDLPYRNPFINSSGYKLHDPIIDTDFFKVTPLFTTINTSFNVTLTFTSLYKMLDHLYYIKLKSRNGGSNLKREIEPNLGFVSEFVFPVNLDWIADPSLKADIETELLKQDIRYVTFMNDEPGYKFQMIQPCRLVVESVRGNSQKTKEELMPKHTIEITLNARLNFPSFFNVEAVSVIESIQLHVVDSIMTITSDLEVAENISTTDNGVLIKDGIQVFKNDLTPKASWNITLEFPDTDYSKYIVYMKRQNDLIYQETIYNGDLSDKSQVTLTDVLAEEVIKFFIYEK